jgi:hypothetical protein
MRLTRDVRIIQRQLIAEGRAVWLGQEFPPGPPPPPLDDVARAAARVKALFEERIATGERPLSVDRGRINRQTEAATP